MATGEASVLLLSLVNASISFTIAETKLLKPVREWMKCRSKLLGELFSCGYCFGHWSAFALTAIYRPCLFQIWRPCDLFMTALVIAWLSAFQWIALCRLMQSAGK